LPTFKTASDFVMVFGLFIFVSFFTVILTMIYPWQLFRHIGT
jgi:hypothetical protein